MYSLIRNLLFQLDAESAHDFTATQMMRLQELPLVPVHLFAHHNSLDMTAESYRPINFST